MTPYLSRTLLFGVLIAAFGVFLTACSKEKGCTDPLAVNYNPDAEESDNSCVYPKTVDQAVITNVYNVGRLGITGVFENAPSSAHNGEPASDPNTTIRDIFSTATNTGIINPGDAVVKRIYNKLPNGKRGSLNNVAIMIKQPEGYYPEGGDWQYVSIPGVFADDININGQLDKATDNGRVAACANCHAQAAGGNFLFYR